MLMLVGLSLMVLSCKKDNPDPLLNDVLGSMTMKIDGQPWSAKMAYVVTAIDPEEEDVFAIAISGFAHEGEEDGEGLTIWMVLPTNKFENPKGTYDMAAVDSDWEGQGVVWAMYSKSLGTDMQQLYGTAEVDKPLGKLTITDFKIGQQTFLGEVIGGRAYTQLKGTFELNLTELKTDGSGLGETMAITEGKFAVKNQLSF